MSTASNDLQEKISVGCAVRVYCSTEDERATYRIVRNRNFVEYKPRFGIDATFGRGLYYEAVTKFAEYADDELLEDCPLGQALIGRVLGDSFKINEYDYKIEMIVFPDGRTSELAPVQTVAEPKPKAAAERHKIDWDRGFAEDCTDEELQIIRDFEAFMAEEFPHFVGTTKWNRIAFFDPNKQLDGVQYSQFWFIKRGGVLLFRFKLDQNERDEFEYSNNVLVADSLQFLSIKILVRLILSSK